jgi:phage tail-like protein
MTAFGGAGQAAFAAPASMGTVLTTNPPSRGGSRVRFGMTMWFKVTVDALGDLGHWSGCSGLGVRFNNEPVKESINLDWPRFVPVSVSYGEITLERAMTATDSPRVQKWLKTVLGAWVNGQEGGAPGEPGGLRGTTVTITLYSALRAGGDATNEVAEWRLANAYPVAWSGPTLSSKGGDVAIEKLTIAHSGFLTGGTSTQPPDREPSGEGRLRLSHKGRTLPLQYNPEKVTMNKQVTIKDETKGPTYVRDEQVTEPGKLSISFEARVEGATAVATATSLLWEWLEPRTPLLIGANRPTPPSEKWTPAVVPGRNSASEAKKPARDAKDSSGDAKKSSDDAKKSADDAKKSAGDGTKPADGEKKKSGSDTRKGANNARPKVLLLQLGTGAGQITRDVVCKQVNTTFTRFTRAGVPSRATISITLEEAAQAQEKTNPTSGSPPGGRVHTVIEGESLPAVAASAYGTPGAWRDVAEHNGIDDPLRLRNGSPLYLPGA